VTRTTCGDRGNPGDEDDLDFPRVATVERHCKCVWTDSGLSGLTTIRYSCTPTRDLSRIPALRPILLYHMLAGRQSVMTVRTSCCAKKKKTRSLEWVPISSAGRETSRYGMAPSAEMNIGQGVVSSSKWDGKRSELSLWGRITRRDLSFSPDPSLPCVRTLAAGLRKTSWVGTLNT